MAHTEPRSKAGRLTKHCRNWPPRSWFVSRHRCHFVKQGLGLAIHTTSRLAQIESAAVSSLMRENSGRCDFYNAKKGMHYELKREKQRCRQRRTGVDLVSKNSGFRVNLDFKLCAGMGHQPHEWQQNRNRGCTSAIKIVAYQTTIIGGATWAAYRSSPNKAAHQVPQTWEAKRAAGRHPHTEFNGRQTRQSLPG